MVSGYCDERFLDAKEILEKSIDSGFELGCAISLEVKGEKVMDLWGGYVDPDKTQLWEENTIVNVFSTTKGVAAICLLQLIEKGVITEKKFITHRYPFARLHEAYQNAAEAQNSIKTVVEFEGRS